VLQFGRAYSLLFNVSLTQLINIREYFIQIIIVQRKSLADVYKSHSDQFLNITVRTCFCCMLGRILKCGSS
jgi:hypothetical protein